MSAVAIQGIRGSYSEQAAHEICGGAANILECESFAAAFQSLAERRADFAVIPFENKIVGDITIPHTLLKNTNLKIARKLTLAIKHVLVGTGDSDFEKLQTVRSHIEALRQCRRFLANTPNLQPISGADTASSIRRIVEENNSFNAAIGSRRAAEIYGAKILKENIADDSENWTTFYLLTNAETRTK